MAGGEVLLGTSAPRITTPWRSPTTWLASEQERRSCGDCFIDVLDEDDDSMRPIMWPMIRAMRSEGVEWPPRWDRDRIF